LVDLFLFCCQPIEVNVVAHPIQSYAVWFGGSVAASTPEFYEVPATWLSCDLNKHALFNYSASISAICADIWQLNAMKPQPMSSCYNWVPDSTIPHESISTQVEPKWFPFSHAVLPHKGRVWGTWSKHMQNKPSFQRNVLNFLNIASSSRSSFRFLRIEYSQFWFFLTGAILIEL
jgi:hypothetical protein